METKTAKIVGVQENQRQWEWQGTQFYDHWVKFEGDPNVWTYASKSAQCDKFKTGEEATFTIEVKQRGQYTDHKIKPAQTNGFTGGSKAAPKDQGIITYLSCLSSAANYFAQRTCTDEDVFKMAERAFKTAMEKSTLTK